MTGERPPLCPFQQGQHLEPWPGFLATNRFVSLEADKSRKRRLLSEQFPCAAGLVSVSQLSGREYQWGGLEAPPFPTPCLPSLQSPDSGLSAPGGGPMLV